MERAAASGIDLLRNHLPASTAVAMATVSPGTGMISWTAGRLPGGRPVTTRTPMYAGSISKQFIAALVAGAILAGRLEYDASVRRILPILPPWAELVRVRHLIHHTAGLPSTVQLLAALQLTDEAALDNHLVLQGLSRLPDLHHRPGRVFDYSNIGYVLLAEVLRRTLGTDPAALTHAALITPLKLADTSIGRAPPAALPQPPPGTVGDGGLWTTAIDLLRWLDALNRGLLGHELTGLLQTAGHLDDGTPLDYAWGITVCPSAVGITYAHGGSWPGWTAKTVRNPDAGTALALLTGSDDAHLVSDLAMAIHERLLVDAAAPPIL